MPIDSYTQGMSYEILIRRAHQCERGTRNGADLAYMRNLIDKEYQLSNVAHLPPANKQLGKVKEYLLKAIDKFLKKKLTEQENVQILALRAKVETATHSSMLMQVVDSALVLTDRFK